MSTVTKALSLLAHFNHGRVEIGLSDMTRLSGFNKATVYRMLSDLQDAGFVEQAGSGRAYRLGPEVLRLAALREAAVPVLSASRDILRRLCDETGETTHLSLIKGKTLHSLTHCYSNRHGTRVMMDDAEILTFHGTASGLAVLAYAPKDFVEAALNAPLAIHTDATITDPEEIRARLDHVRRIGFAESVGGFEADVHSHAIPVFDSERKVIGALSVAAPVARSTLPQITRIRSQLRQAANELIHSIGGFFPPDFPQEDAA